MAGTLTISTLSDGTYTTSATNLVRGPCVAWVNFNGTGTVAIRASYNVSSITDNGTGDYTVNFTNAITDANYSVVSMGGRNPDGTGGERQAWNYADRYSTTSVRILVTQTNGSGFDQPSMYVAVNR